MTRYLEIMKSKNFLILVLFILATSISVWLVTVPTPTFTRIMTRTHKQINSLKSMANQKKNEPNVDDTYLELLGFNSNVGLYPDVIDPNLNVPVIVTAAMSDNMESTVKLIKSVRMYLSDRFMAVFDLGLNSVELLQLKKYCNVSMNCTVKSFDFSKFPGHLRDSAVKAYIPVTIQRALTEFGAVLWTDSEEYFITDKIDQPLKQAEQTGIAAWSIKSEEPTSAFTHPRMFKYFQTQPDKFFFLHMVGMSHLVIYNNRKVHEKLMLQWVKCALTWECICPMGAQAFGCHIDRRPLYKYSRCHKFTMSALNVILGLTYDYNHTRYIVENKIFGVEIENNKLLQTTDESVDFKEDAW